MGFGNGAIYAGSEAEVVGIDDEAARRHWPQFSERRRSLASSQELACFAYRCSGSGRGFAEEEFDFFEQSGE